MSDVIDNQNAIQNFRSPVCNIIRSILNDIGCTFEENNNKFYIEYNYIYDCELTVDDEDGSLSLLTQLCLITPETEMDMLESALQYNLDYGWTRGASIYASKALSVLLFKTRFPALKMDYYEVSDAIARFLDSAERLGLALTGQGDKIPTLTSRAPPEPDDLAMDDFFITRP